MIYRSEFHTNQRCVVGFFQCHRDLPSFQFAVTPSYWKRSSKKGTMICFLSGSTMENQGTKINN